MLITGVHVVEQSVYQKFGPNLENIATEMNHFGVTPYTYWLIHVKNLEKSKHGKYFKNTNFITR